MGRGVSVPAPWHVRAGALGRAIAEAGRRARSRRRKAALLDRDAARAAARLGGEGAAGAARGLPRARRGRARSVPHLRIRAGAADDAQGCSQAAAGPLSRVPGRQGQHPTLLGCRRRRAAELERRGSGRGPARGAAERGVQPAHGRRPARGVPFRRHRFEHPGRAHDRSVFRAGEKLQHRLRRRHLQRAAICARDCGAVRHAATGSRWSRPIWATCSRGWWFTSTSRSPTCRCFRPLPCRSWRERTSRLCCRAMAATSCLAATTPTRRRPWPRVSAGSATP